MEFYKGFKYQLAEDEVFQTKLFPQFNVVTDLIELHQNGRLLVKRFYAWDGASGPVVDRKSNYSASCAHDALYELIRKGKLPRSFWRLADAEYLKFLDTRGGANRLTIWIDSKGLALAKGRYANPKKRRKLRRAP